MLHHQLHLRLLMWRRHACLWSGASACCSTHLLATQPDCPTSFRSQVESTNPNTVGTGALSSPSTSAHASGVVILGKLAQPAAPELVWVLEAGGDPAHAELRFEAITAPPGSSPTYGFQLYNASESSPTAVGSWQAIDLTQATGAGTSGDKYKYRLPAAPVPGKYTATLRAKTALGDSATSNESGPSAAEVTGAVPGWLGHLHCAVFTACSVWQCVQARELQLVTGNRMPLCPCAPACAGVTSQPGIEPVGSGDSTIVTEDDGATTVVLLVTLPTSTTGE